jgi:hypothetical protein
MLSFTQRNKIKLQMDGSLAFAELNKGGCLTTFDPTKIHFIKSGLLISPRDEWDPWIKQQLMIVNPNYWKF